MSEGLTFEDVKALVETGYPTPVASVFRRCRVASREDLGGRHKNLIDLFEVFVKFLCVVELQEARRVVPNLKDRLPQKEKTLQFLKRPSLGGWVGLLRILSGLKPGAAEPVWMPRIAEWYGRAKTPEGAAALAALGEIEGVKYEKRTKTPNAEICNALVNYRNKQLAHAANIRDEELSRRLPVLESVLAYLLNSASFLGEMTTFQTERIEVAENNRWKVHAVRLAGATEEPTSFVCSKKLDLSEMYLADRADGELESPPVALGPFLLWQVNEDLKRPEVYFYNDAWRTKLEYLSYSSGSYYYHKELHSGFSDLITLKLKPGVEEDAHRFMPAEERAARAEDLYKRAMVLVEQERYEDALEALELAAEYERRADVFIRMAEVRLELGDPPAAVQQTIQSCLDLEPGNERALALRSRLEAGAEERDVVREEEPRDEPMPFPTAFHAFTPRRLRGYALVWWLALITGWYGFSAVAEALTSHPENLVPNALQCACCYVFGFAIFVGRPILQRLRLPLSLQLDAMRLERFGDWFDDQLRFALGSYSFREGRLQFRETVRGERAYYCGWAALVLVIGVSAFYLSGSWKVPLPLMVKRFVDYALIYLIVIPTARYAVATTVFVYRYSRLSLKPMLTTLNDDGLRSLGSLIKFDVGATCVAYVVYWLLASYVVTMEFRGDFFFLAVASLVCMVWSVGLPVMIHRAAREAKSKSAHAYSAHIEKSYRAFLDDPDEEKLARYQWLVKNQKVIRKIPTWPLSWTATAFVVLGSNLVLLAVDAWYVLVRLGHWPAVAEWMLGLVR